MSDVYKTIAESSLVPLLRKIVALKTKISTNVPLSIDEIKELYKFKEFFDANKFVIPEPRNSNNSAPIPPQRFGNTHTHAHAIDYSAPKPSAPLASTYPNTAQGSHEKLGTTVISVGSGATMHSQYNKEIVKDPNVRSNLDKVDDVVHQQSKEWMRKLDYIRSTHENYVLVDIHDDDCDSFEIVDKGTDGEEDKQIDTVANSTDNRAKSEDIEMTEIYSGDQDNGIITLKDEIAKQAAQFKNRQLIMSNSQKKHFSPFANPIDINPMIHSYC